MLELPQLSINLQCNNLWYVDDKIDEFIYLLKLMLEVCPAHTDTSAESMPPLVVSSIHDRLVNVFPLVDQTRF